MTTRTTLLATHILAFAVVATPLFAFADTSASFIPCDGYTKECDFNQAIVLVNNIIQLFFKVLVPAVVMVVLVYAGWILITKGSRPGAIKIVKAMLINLLVGLIFVVAAFLIVKTILKILGYVPPGGLNFIGL